MIYWFKYPKGGWRYNRIVILIAIVTLISMYVIPIIFPTKTSTTTTSQSQSGDTSVQQTIVDSTVNQNITIHTDTKQKGLFIFPESKNINCDGWTSSYNLKIVNNFNEPKYDVVAMMEYDFSLVGKVAVIKASEGITFIGLIQCNESTGCIHQVMIGEIDPGQTVNIPIKVSAIDCNGSYQINSSILRMNDDPGDTKTLTTYEGLCDDQEIKKAEVLFLQKNYSEAIIHYRNAMRTPYWDCRTAQYGMADAYYMLGNYTNAEKWIEQVPNQYFEQSWNLLQTKADIKLKNDKYDEAIMLYEKAFLLINYSQNEYIKNGLVIGYCTAIKTATKLEDNYCTIKNKYTNQTIILGKLIS